MAETFDIDQVLEENAKARAELLEAVDAIPSERRLETAFGEWSVKDVVVNIAAWQDAFAQGLELLARGERPVMPDFEDNDIDRWNGDRQRESQDQSWETVLGRLSAARERHDAAVRGLGALDADRLAVGKTAHRLANSADHDREHAADILEWRRAQGL